MIIWGSRGKVLNLGGVETKYCQTCEKERPYSLIVEYRYAHLYWIFRIVTRKRFLILCNICGQGWEIDGKTLISMRGENPISKFDRYGLLIFIGIIVGIPMLTIFIGSIFGV